MQKKLLALSMVEGAAVMAAELCGAKLLAPIFGSSLYVWASVMGITLAALAFGYFFGGWLSDKKEQLPKHLFRVVTAAALLAILMPVLSYYLVPRISYLPFLMAVVSGTFALLFLPVFFMGATSPLLIALQTSENNGGRVSGTVYAVSTLGGIIATFLCGFYLIPQIGLNACMLCFGGSLFITNLVVFRTTKPYQLLLCAGFIYLNLQFIVKKSGQLLVSDSLLGHLEVEEHAVLNDTIRILKVNNIIQTEMSLRSKRSVSGYVALLDTLIAPAAKPGRALVLGLGGGLTANLLIDKNYMVDGVELDERIIRAAQDYFFMDQHVKGFYEDARYFLNHCSKTYKLVLVDVFKAEEQPSHVLTLESLARLKQNLDPAGRIYINWHGYAAGEAGQGTAVLYHTLIAAGFHVKISAASMDEDHRNLLFVASLQPLPALAFEQRMDLSGTQKTNSDNFPRLERSNALANKKWRSSYLRYYQNR